MELSMTSFLERKERVWQDKYITSCLELIVKFSSLFKKCWAELNAEKMRLKTMSWKNIQLISLFYQW